MARATRAFLSFVLLLCIAKFNCGEVVHSSRNGRSPLGRQLLQVGETAEPTKPVRGQLTFLPQPLPTTRRFCGFTGAANETCGMDQLIAYGEQIGVFAFPGALLLVLSLLSLVIFFTGRCCCNLFGGRNPSPGIFCGGNEGECCSCFSRGEFEGYTRRERMVVMILAVLISAVLIFVPIQGFLGSARFHQGVPATVNNVNSQLSYVNNQILLIEAKLARLPYINATAQLDTVINQIANVNNTIQTNTLVINYYETVRMAVLYAIFALVVFMGLLGVIAASLRVFRMSHCLAVASFMVSALVWLVFAVHLPLDLLFIDSCAELGRVQDGTSSLLPCVNGTISQLAPTADQAEDGINNAFDTICGYSRQACNNTYCSETCSRANAATYNNSIIEDAVPGCYWPNGTCFAVDNSTDLVTRCPLGTPPSAIRRCNLANLTVAQCSRHCQNKDLKNYSVSILYALDIAIEYEEILEADVRPIISCSYAAGVSSSLAANICGQLGSGVDDVATSALVIGCFLMPYTVLMLLAFKRLRRGHHEDADESSGDVELSVASPPPKLPVEFEVESSAAELYLIGGFNRWAVAGPDAIRMQPSVIDGQTVHRSKVQLEVGTYDYAYHDPATRQRIFDKKTPTVGDVHVLTVTKQGRPSPALHQSREPLMSEYPPQQEGNTAASYQQPAVSADYRPPTDYAPVGMMLATPSASNFDQSSSQPQAASEEPQFDDYAQRYLEPQISAGFESNNGSTASTLRGSHAEIGLVPYQSDTIYMTRPPASLGHEHHNESDTSGDY